jgi:hypothetical protein
MNKKIKDIIINSFLKQWYKNTNEKIVIDSENNISVNNRDLLFLYKELLTAFIGNSNKYKIVGSDKAKSFSIGFSDEDTMLQTAQDIWNNPHDYYKFHKDDDEYYEFLKFLWIEYPNGNEERLTDCINTN